VKCHHGETSHISEIGLADILSDLTPIQKYQQDKQPHEELAYKLQLPTIDDSNLDNTRSVCLFLSFNIPLQSPLLPSQSGMTNSPNSSLDDELTKMLENMRSERERMRSSTARFARWKHHPRTVKASPAQRKRIVALPIPNGLEAKGDSTVGGSTSNPSTIVSESKDTWKSTQDGQSATDPSRDFRGVSMSTLNEMQEGMIKKIMTIFWARFDDWLPKTTGYAGKSTTSQTASNGYEGHRMSSTWTASSRRARNSDSSFKGGNGAEKPYNRPSKPPRKSGDTCKDRDRTLDFACPFKKRHPRRYNLDEHRSCTIGHWPSIALMKSV
jgi:hypothetical protein